MDLLPRFIRYRDAPGYLGMDRNRFDAEVRPELTEIPIGERGIAFDRRELDAWADAYIARVGRRSKRALAVDVVLPAPEPLPPPRRGRSPAPSAPVPRSGGMNFDRAMASCQATIEGAGQRTTADPKRGMTNFDRAMEVCFGPPASAPRFSTGDPERDAHFARIDERRKRRIKKNDPA